ncbi:Hsp70 family protein, partial [Mycobacterium senriense]
MAIGVGTALGLSIGATNLAAVTADNAITRKPVLTLYPDRPAEIGIPAENPRLQGPGVVITGFVNRVGDPRGVVAVDGSVHRSEVLVADALRALAYAATGGRALPDDVAVTYPAHWESHAVEALGTALSEIPEWARRTRPTLLIPDAAATLLAVRTSPGIPPRGTVAVCDFGGTGTNITLMHADGDYRALAPTVRHREFSGDLIDQALLGAVIANMPTTGAFPSGNVAIGSLSRLRSACRIAKEQLSSGTVATLTDGLTGTRGEVRLTRDELDDAIRPSLNRTISALDEALARNGIRDLVAVVSTGGGANLPTVTTALSRHFRVPVATTPRPQLAAAVGAALRVA